MSGCGCTAASRFDRTRVLIGWRKETFRYFRRGMAAGLRSARLGAASAAVAATAAVMASAHPENSRTTMTAASAGRAA